MSDFFEPESKDDNIEKDGVEIIRSNIIAINNKAKEEYFKISSIGDTIVDSILQDILKLDVEKRFKMWERICNIKLAMRELDVDLVKPNSSGTSIIFQTNKSEDNDINKFADSLDSETMRKIDGFMKTIQTITNKS